MQGLERGATHAAQPETVALFLSDLHLQEAMPKTLAAFLSFLRERALAARQLYLLGDLFEYWPGDDDLDAPFNRMVVDAVRAVADAGVSVFWISGNRDFLIGAEFARRAGLTLLTDPFVTEIAGRRVVLAHGDAQCTDDHGYMAFRTQVRQPAWQQAFLAQPLAERKRIIEGVRMQSREAQRGKPAEIMDVNDAAVAALFESSGAQIMIHGHTHRPARHAYPGKDGPRLRYVLPDWDLEGPERRGGWIAIDGAGTVRRHGWNGVVLD